MERTECNDFLLWLQSMGPKAGENSFYRFLNKSMIVFDVFVNCQKPALYENKASTVVFIASQKYFFSCLVEQFFRLSVVFLSFVQFDDFSGADKNLAFQKSHAETHSFRS